MLDVHDVALCRSQTGVMLCPSLGQSWMRAQFGRDRKIQNRGTAIELEGHTEFHADNSLDCVHR